MRSELERVLDKLLLEASGASAGTTKYLDVDGQEYEVTIAELISTIFLLNLISQIKKYVLKN